MTDSIGVRERPAAAGFRPGLPLDKVAIWGVGLMGGSLGMALRAAGAAREIIGIGRNPKALERAVRLGAIDRWVTDPAGALEPGLELLVLGAPVETIIAQAAEWAPRLPPGCVATDLGSTKAAIVAAWEPRAAPGAAFVGSHPMCGSDRTGVEHARADLYRNAPWVLTPTDRTPREAVARVAAIALAVDARTYRMPPDEHDHRVAFISHLPQLVAVAAAAAAQAGEEAVPGTLDLAAGGFRDTTRIAASSPDVWLDIFFTNQGPVLEALAAFRQALDGLEQAVRAGDPAAVRHWFERAHRARHSREWR